MAGQAAATHHAQMAHPCSGKASAVVAAFTALGDRNVVDGLDHVAGRKAGACQVTGRAIARRALEDALQVAGLAARRGVGAYQGKAGAQVVKIAHGRLGQRAAGAQQRQPQQRQPQPQPLTDPAGAGSRVLCHANRPCHGSGLVMPPPSAELRTRGGKLFPARWRMAVVAARTKRTVMGVVASVAAHALPVQRRRGLAGRCRLAVAGRAGQRGMGGGQRIVGLGLVVEVPQSPVAHAVAAVATLAQAGLVLVVLAVTADAVAWRIAVAQAQVAIGALDGDMAAGQRKARAGVVEAGFFPGYRGMAGLAARVELGFVLVVLAVATDAVQRRGAVLLGVAMAGVTAQSPPPLAVASVPPPPPPLPSPQVLCRAISTAKL